MSSQKAFHFSQSATNKKKRSELWRRQEANCPSLVYASMQPTEMVNIFQGISKVSQSSLPDQMLGRVKISNQQLYSVESKFFKATYYGNIAGSKPAMFECMTGLAVRQEDFNTSRIDYFQNLVNHIQYLKNETDYALYTNGKAEYCRLVDNIEKLEQAPYAPNQVAWVLSIRGAHILAPSIYTDQNQEDELEFRKVSLDNVERLKGIRPLEASSAGKAGMQYINLPIFSISFDSYFKDGYCGHTPKLPNGEMEAYESASAQASIKGFSPAGQDVVKKLLDKEKGRRILVDLAGMSVESRQWYYEYVKELKYKKDTVPVFFTNVGIAGLKCDENNYRNRNEIENENQKTVLNPRQSNLCYQDIQEVRNSNGLVGISLEKYRLMGEAMRNRYHNQLQPHSAERRRVAVEAVAANLCKFVESFGNSTGWDYVCISSNFDGFAEHLEFYNSSDDLPSLAKDLYEFFRAPRDIEGLFKKKEILKIMGVGESPKPEALEKAAASITERVIFKNAYNFLLKNFPKTPQP